ncbi:hypothetical protein [Hymenobacter psychrophilus]|uniref:hypothetical protein n=1 Tax=Hymenobacter psychrophilus TaxID=651662 RepID=UPI00111505E2|nr:hypothetical protein [Hymenobacter psychrophilus]
MRANFLHKPGRGRRATCWAAALLLAACRPAAEQPISSIGFEDVEGWVVPTPPWLTNDPVHNGRRAFALLNTENYGLNITRPWGSLGRPRTLEVGTWVNLPHGRTHVALIVQVNRGDPAEVRYYKLIPIHEVVKRYNTWQLVHATHELPDDLQDDDIVKVYAWQWDAHYTLFFDDIYLKKLR